MCKEQGMYSFDKACYQGRVQGKRGMKVDTSYFTTIQELNDGEDC